MIYLVILSLVAIVVLLNGWFVLEARLAKSRCPPIGEVVRVGEVGLHCIIRGAGLPVVLLHGNDGSFLDFSHTILEAVAKTYRAIVFDRPGHGYSERPAGDAGSPVAQARLIHYALKQLGVEKPLLVAHSWSGYLALAYALEHPDEVSGLVLLGAAVYARRHPLPIDKRIILIPALGGFLYSTAAPLVGRFLLRRAMQRSFAPDEIPAGWLDKCAALYTWKLSQVRAAAGDFVGPWQAMPFLEERYHQIRIPVAVVTGDCDRSVPPEEQSYRLHRQLPASRLIVVPGMGHMVQFTHPAVITDAIKLAWEQADAAGVRD